MDPITSALESDPELVELLALAPEDAPSYLRRLIERDLAFCDGQAAVIALREGRPADVTSGPAAPWWRLGFDTQLAIMEGSDGGARSF